MRALASKDASFDSEFSSITALLTNCSDAPAQKADSVKKRRYEDDGLKKERSSASDFGGGSYIISFRFLLPDSILICFDR